MVTSLNLGNIGYTDPLGALPTLPESVRQNAGLDSFENSLRAAIFQQNNTPPTSDILANTLGDTRDNVMNDILSIGAGSTGTTGSNDILAGVLGDTRENVTNQITGPLKEATQQSSQSPMDLINALDVAATGNTSPSTGTTSLPTTNNPPLNTNPQTGFMPETANNTTNSQNTNQPQNQLTQLMQMFMKLMTTFAQSVQNNNQSINNNTFQQTPLIA